MNNFMAVRTTSWPRVLRSKVIPSIEVACTGVGTGVVDGVAIGSSRGTNSSGYSMSKRVVLVQGRYDMVCPPQTSWLLSKAMPHAEYTVVQDAGHSAMEPGLISALVSATEKFKAL